MRLMVRLFLIASCLGGSLQAVTPHVGFGVNLTVPTGRFNSTTYPASSAVTTPQTESYDLGIGAQFTLSFPVDPRFAIRLNVSDQTTSGHNTAAGYETINLKHNLFSIGGDLQFFPASGNATEHRGLYLLGGLSADFERFDRSFGDPNWDYTSTFRKSRMGGSLGVGHTFGGAYGPRFNVEGSFHKTLTSCSVNAGDPPATDFAKVSIGMVW